MKNKSFKIVLGKPNIRLGIPGKMVRGGKHGSGKTYSRKTGKRIGQ